jgi:putative copper export protein
MYPIILFLHIISATVWTGGHLVLAIAILPRAIKHRSTSTLQQFESWYEPLGMPAFGLQLITGLWLAWRYLPDVKAWVSFSSPFATLIACKLLLVILSLLLALDARLRLIPTLSPATLPALAWHILAITLLSVLFVGVGVGFRVGGFF